MKKILFAMLMSALIFTGCNAKDTIKSVILKTYNVVCAAEGIVKNSDTATFVSIAQILDPALGYVNTSLIYINGKVTDEKVKAAIEKTIVIITNVKLALKTITPENLEATKLTVIASIDNIKGTVVTIGKYFGVEFPTVVAASNVDPAKQLKDAMEELSKALPKK